MDTTTGDRAPAEVRQWAKDSAHRRLAHLAARDRPAHWVLHSTLAAFQDNGPERYAVEAQVWLTADGELWSGEVTHGSHQGSTWVTRRDGRPMNDALVVSWRAQTGGYETHTDGSRARRPAEVPSTRPPCDGLVTLLTAFEKGTEAPVRKRDDQARPVAVKHVSLSRRAMLGAGVLAVAGAGIAAAQGWHRRLTQPDRVVVVHDAPVASLAAAPGSRLLITAAGRVVRLWQLDSAGVPAERPLRTLTVPVDVDLVTISPQGNAVAVLDKNGTLSVWSPAGRHLAEIRNIWRSFSGLFRPVAFSRDGQMLAVCTLAGLQILSSPFASARKVAAADGFTSPSVAFGAGDRRLIVAAGGATARMVVVDSRKGALVQTVDVGQRCFSVQMAADGARVWAGTDDGVLTLSQPALSVRDSLRPGWWPGEGNSVSGLDIDPIGDLIAGGFRGQASVWRVSDGTAMGHVTLPTSWKGLAFLDPRRLGVGVGRTMQIFDLSGSRPQG